MNVRYRFGVFEFDVGLGQLKRKGRALRLAQQPVTVLAMLLERPGELIAREEIVSRLWGAETFVDYEHGINAAVNRIREALGDEAKNPRFVETVARQGYRWIAPAEVVNGLVVGGEAAGVSVLAASAGAAAGRAQWRILATEEDLPKGHERLALRLFVGLQLMYLGFYIGALGNFAEIQELLTPVPSAGIVGWVTLGSAIVLIPARAFLICAVLFKAPRFRGNLLRLWPVLLVADLLWSLSPFLLLHHINFGLAAAAAALLVYAPFAERSLVLMSAGEIE